MIQMFIWKSELTLQKTSIISLVEEQKFLFCNQHYELNVFSLLISLLQPIDTGGIKLNADFWSNFEWFPSKIVHCFFGNVSWPPRSPFLAIERVFFLAHPSIPLLPHPILSEFWTPAETSRFFAPCTKMARGFEKKELRLWAWNNAAPFENLEGCSAARGVSLCFETAKCQPTTEISFAIGRFLVAEINEKFCAGGLRLPCVRVFFFVETLLQGRFPAKKHIVNGRDTIDGRNPVNHLACINLVNL